MDHKSMSFSAFCAWLGLPLKNDRWSWCAYSEEQRRCFFTLWDHERLPNGTWEFPWLNEGGTSSRGRNEFRKLFDRVVCEDYDVFGILCFSREPNVMPVKRTGFERSSLKLLKLQKMSDRRIAHVIGESEVDSVRREFAGFLMHNGSALDDLNFASIDVLAPKMVERNGLVYARDEEVRRRVIKRSDGQCEYCGIIPFEKVDGRPYLETHHIIYLSKQGRDKLDNVIALCPNHHREAHFGTNKELLEKEFLQIIERVQPKKRVRRKQ